MRRSPLSLCLLLALTGCASAPGPEANDPTTTPEAPSGTAEEAPPAPEEAAPEAGEEFSEDEEAALAAIEASELDDPKGAPERNILYRLTQQGLHVEVEGADFAPQAKSKKVRDGLGLELSVRATSTADLVLLASADGPLAFGGKVKRSSGKVEKFGDRRSDGSNVPLGPKTPQTFTRTWPSGDLAPLSPGDELELHVGLWGLGQDTTNRRPIRKFVVVKMKASPEGGVPLVEPPAQ